MKKEAENVSQPPLASSSDGVAPPRTSPIAAVDPATFVDLAKLSQESFFNRREIEWRSAFGLWTAIGAWTYVSVTNAAVLVKLPLQSFPKLLVILTVALFVGWQLPLRRAFEDDKRWKHYFMKRAAGIPVEPPESAGFLTGVTELRHWPWTFSQLAVTIVFLIASWCATHAAIAQAVLDRAAKP